MAIPVYEKIKKMKFQWNGKKKTEKKIYLRYITYRNNGRELRVLSVRGFGANKIWFMFTKVYSLRPI